MASHRYWRVEFKVSGVSVPTGADEIEMRESVGGADVTSSAFASAQSQNGPNGPANAFSNGGGFWASDGSDAAGAWVWIQQDFGAGNEKDIAEVQVQTDEISSIDVEGVRISYSDNGADFTITDTYDTPQADNTTQQYLVTGSGGGGGGGSPTPAFNVQHGTLDVAAGGSTQAITAVDSLASTIALNNNSRLIGGGPDGTAPSLDVDDASLGVRLTAVDEITLDREAAASGTNRASWSAWSYIGASGGANEFIVRDRRTITLSASDSATFTASGISNADKVIPFITGIRHNSATTNHDLLTAATEINRTTGEVTIHGRGGAGTAVIEVTTVEFTGSNWAVAYGTTTSDADTGTITITSGVSDWANASIFHQFSKGVNQINGAIADVTPTYVPGASTTSVDWTFDGQHDGDTDQRHTVYALHNADMTVTRFSSTDDSAGNVDIDITSAGVSDIAEALVIVSAQTSGGGAAHLRGTRNAQITSTTNARHYAPRSGNTVSVQLQIVSLPQDAASTGVLKGRDGGTFVAGVLKGRASGTFQTGTLKERVSGTWTDRA